MPAGSPTPAKGPAPQGMQQEESHLPKAARGALTKREGEYMLGILGAPHGGTTGIRPSCLGSDTTASDPMAEAQNSSTWPFGG